MPVISPVSADDAGVVLNINADTVAAAVGAALGAEKLILCTGAPGILERREDPRSLVSYTDLPGLKRLEGAGSLEDGMLPKASAIEWRSAAACGASTSFPTMPATACSPRCSRTRARAR